MEQIERIIPTNDRTNRTNRIFAFRLFVVLFSFFTTKIASINNTNVAIDIAIADINLTDKSMERVSKIDDATIFSNSSLQSGLMAEASAEAMKSAASNSNGAMMGFMGMNMAQNSGATMMGAVQKGDTVSNEEREMPEPGSLFKKEEAKKEESVQEANVEESSTGPKFCPNCGAPANGGNFCTNCGNKLR